MNDRHPHHRRYRQLYYCLCSLAAKDWSLAVDRQSNSTTGGHGTIAASSTVVACAAGTGGGGVGGRGSERGGALLLDGDSRIGDAAAVAAVAAAASRRTDPSCLSFPAAAAASHSNRGGSSGNGEENLKTTTTRTKTKRSLADTTRQEINAERTQSPHWTTDGRQYDIALRKELVDRAVGQSPLSAAFDAGAAAAISATPGASYSGHHQFPQPTLSSELLQQSFVKRDITDENYYRKRHQLEGLLFL